MIGLEILEKAVYCLVDHLEMHHHHLHFFLELWENEYYFDNGLLRVLHHEVLILVVDL